MKKKNKVVIAMSGGVDSSVAAVLLKKAGFEVIGIFLKFWLAPRSFSEAGSPNQGTVSSEQGAVENKCCSMEAAEAARKVAQKLNIPFYTLNFEKDFKREVVDYFLKEYKAGRTPNPCIKCNQFIKFGKLLEKARDLGADFLATGHYVRVLPLGFRHFSHRPLPGASRLLSGLAGFPPSSKNGYNLALLEAVDKQKNQSYFLWTLKPEQLKHLIFPIGDYTKDEVRKMAKKWGLPSAARRESQEICFVYGELVDFLKRYIKPRAGKIIDKSGKILGGHDGAQFYTIGQRQNLNIKPFTPTQKPYYVIKTDIKKNLVVVGEEKDLYSKELMARDVNWIDRDLRQRQSFECLARIRYGHPKTKVKVKRKKEKVRIKEQGAESREQRAKLLVEFEKPQRAITPGQSVVFYRGEKVLGGGIIK